MERDACEAELKQKLQGYTVGYYGPWGRSISTQSDTSAPANDTPTRSDPPRRLSTPQPASPGIYRTNNCSSNSVNTTISDSIANSRICSPQSQYIYPIVSPVEISNSKNDIDLCSRLQLCSFQVGPPDESEAMQVLHTSTTKHYIASVSETKATEGAVYRLQSTSTNVTPSELGSIVESRVLSPRLPHNHNLPRQRPESLANRNYVCSEESTSINDSEDQLHDRSVSYHGAYDDPINYNCPNIDDERYYPDTRQFNYTDAQMQHNMNHFSGHSNYKNPYRERSCLDPSVSQHMDRNIFRNGDYFQSGEGYISYNDAGIDNIANGHISQNYEQQSSINSYSSSHSLDRRLENKYYVNKADRYNGNKRIHFESSEFNREHVRNNNLSPMQSVITDRNPVAPSGVSIDENLSWRRRYTSDSSHPPLSPKVERFKSSGDGRHVSSLHFVPSIPQQNACSDDRSPHMRNPNLYENPSTSVNFRIDQPNEPSTHSSRRMRNVNNASRTRTPSSDRRSGSRSSLRISISPSNGNFSSWKTDLTADVSNAAVHVQYSTDESVEFDNKYDGRRPSHHSPHQINIVSNIGRSSCNFSEEEFRQRNRPRSRHRHAGKAQSWYIPQNYNENSRFPSSDVFSKFKGNSLPPDEKISRHKEALTSSHCSSSIVERVSWNKRQGLLCVAGCSSLVVACLP